MVILPINKKNNKIQPIIERTQPYTQGTIILEYQIKGNEEFSDANCHTFSYNFHILPT